MAGRINRNPRSSVRDTYLFQLALGIDSPWFVSASDFDAEGKRLDIEIDFKSGARLPCPDCKAADCPAHDTKLWRVVDHYVETTLAELALLALKLKETKSRPELKVSRYLWLKNDAKLSARQSQPENRMRVGHVAHVPGHLQGTEQAVG